MRSGRGQPGSQLHSSFLSLSPLSSSCIQFLLLTLCGLFSRPFAAQALLHPPYNIPLFNRLAHRGPVFPENALPLEGPPGECLPYLSRPKKNVTSSVKPSILGYAHCNKNNADLSGLTHRLYFSLRTQLNERWLE